MKRTSRSSFGPSRTWVLSLAVAMSAGLVWVVAPWQKSAASHPPPVTRVGDVVARQGLPRPNVPEELRPRSARQLQYVLGLLKNSRDATRPVRILFYGQSITEQGWWKIVEEHLRKTYPLAALTVENRAIGGHPAALLMKTAEADLYPFQPDLVIFHVYGSHKDYEQIIKAIRERTTADIIIATDHVTLDRQLEEETDPVRLTARDWLYRIPSVATGEQKSDNWTAWFNRDFLPRMAQRYAAQLVPVRDAWSAYLRSNRLTAASLLRDDVHLNEQGQRLMAEIIKGYLDPTLVDPQARDDGRLVEIAIAPAGPSAEPLHIPFSGSRVDVVTNGTPMAETSVLVDGKKPCSGPAAYAFDRTSAFPGSNWPSILRVQKGPTPLVGETWTATIESPDVDMRKFRFAVRGSVSGEDGQGNSAERFVSKSGQVVIEPGDWNLAYARRVIKSDVPRPYAISWRATCLGSDTLPAVQQPTGPSSPITIVQGASPGQHVLELPATTAGHVSSVRVYRPDAVSRGL